MGKTILRLIRDLWSDGYKFLGAIAPLASLGFTFTKALEVHVSLRDISYAWAFAPLLAWLFVAYVRRWLAYRELEAAVNNQDNRKNVSIALGRFLPVAETLMTRCRDTTVSPPNAEADSWAQQVEDFLLSNLDESYIARFRDDSKTMPLLPAGMLSQDHTNLYRGLQIRKANLHEFIKELS